MSKKSKPPNTMRRNLLGLQLEYIEISSHEGVGACLKDLARWVKEFGEVEPWIASITVDYGTGEPDDRVSVAIAYDWEGEQ